MPPQSSRYLLAALLLTHSVAHADSDPSQWQCRPKADGQGWDCQAAPVTPGPYRLPPLPTVSDATPVSGPSPLMSRSGEPQTPAQMTAAAALAPRRTLTPAELNWQPSADAGCCEGSYVDPLADIDKISNDPEDSPLKVTADSGELQESGEHFVLEGGIAFQQGYRQGSSNRAEVLRTEDRVIFEGDVTLQEPGLLILADRVQINTATDTGAAENVHFVMYEERIRGDAGRLDILGDGIYQLSDSNYTTCEPLDHAWDLHAGEIHVDQNTGIGTAKDAVLHLETIPVAYIPYLQFPVDDRRMSGFLWPTISHSSNSGFEIATPYYFNLAPNYDATFAPRYIEDRGMMYELGTRYLSPLDEWMLGIAYLNNDTQYRDDQIDNKLNSIPPQPVAPSDYSADIDRWLITLNERGVLGNGWRSRIDYTRVSDDDYFRDLDTVSIEASRQTNLQQTGVLAYTSDLWSFTASLEDYQTLNDDAKEQYALLPHLELIKSADGESFSPSWLLLADYSFFDSDERIRGQRLYTEPGVTFPMRWSAGYITPTAKVRQVNYTLNNSNENGVVYNYTPATWVPPGPAPIMSWPDDPDFIRPLPGTEITGQPSATVPMFSLDAGLFFERDMTWNDSPYLQTFEPRLYYLYADYEDQTNLPNFDTSEIDFSYRSLYRESRFNGYDRLDDANQTTVGVMSRFTDQETGRETFNVGIGQIFYNRDRRVSVTQVAALTPVYTSPYSEIAAEAMYAPSENFRLTTGISWDPDTNKTSEGGFAGQWLPTERMLFNLGYRYRREAPQFDPTTGEFVNSDIDQVDFSAVIPLNHQWRLFARWNYDLTANDSLETLGGIEYESCCWMVRAVYQEAIDGALNIDNNNFVADDELERDYAFFLQFQLKGLGDLADKVDDVLDNAIPGFDVLSGR
ncbi:MAG TPA: LPS-assembly protein LptD [Pseudomonadales bacterium]